MKDKMTNSVNMINATTGYADANPTATAGIPAFVTALGVVKGKIVIVNGLNQIGSGTTKGVTIDTKVLRKVMQDLALKCAKGTLAYANSVNNNTLKAKVNYTEDKLSHEKKEDVDDVCQDIHDAANTNAAAIVNFGVVAADITDLQSAIDVYRAATQNPRNARITITQAKRQAESIVKDIVKNYFVGQMDKMVDTLKASNNDYWNGYKQAREIIDLGSTTAKVRGTVLDENDVPLKGVTFTILKTGTQEKVSEVQTDNKGKFNAAKLPSGNFDFKWEVKGYKTVTETNVHIGPGKELKRKIAMVAAVIIEDSVSPNKTVEISGVAVSITPSSELTIEVMDVDLRFYATDNPSNGPGAVFLDVHAGESVTHTAAEFATALGINATNHFVMVQNSAVFEGHYRITIVG